MSGSIEPGGLKPAINMYGGQAPIDVWGDVALRPSDGYSVEIFDSYTLDALVLYVTFKVGGEFQSKWQYATYPREAEAQCSRVFYLLQAVCRFLNTGGGMQEAQETLAFVSSLVESGQMGTLSFPGFDLLSTRLGGDPVWEHVFGNRETGEVIDWREGEYVDLTTAGEMSRRLHEEEGADSSETEDIFSGLHPEAENGPAGRPGLPLLP